MPKPMTKAELKRRVAEAARNTNHHAEARLVTKAIVEYLDGLKKG